MSEFKLDVAIRGDSEVVTESNSFNGNVNVSESSNGLYRMLDGIHKEWYRLIRNIATNSERMGSIDR